MMEGDQNCHELKIRMINSVSPSFAELLRTCMLRAGLSKTEGARQFVLGNPKAWLGTAYHDVLEAVGSHNDRDPEDIINNKWKSAISRLSEQAQHHPLNRRFSEPEKWPGFHFVAAMVKIRARELFAKQKTTGQGGSGKWGKRPETLREHQFVGAAGKIVGRPDLVSGDSVIDFKTGEIWEDEETKQVKVAYIRQLHIYAFLVKETLGWWPKKGILLPMTGASVEINIEPAECEREVAEVLSLLDSYNLQLEKSQGPFDLAAPSDSVCRWCPYKLICSAFWKSANPEWAEELNAAVIYGKALSLPKVIHGGSAFSLSIEIEEGTKRAGCLDIAPLDPVIHPEVVNVKPSQNVYIVGLKNRADGEVSVTKWTEIISESSLPVISIARVPDLKQN